MLKDDKGLQLPAITVFSLAIGFLKDNLLDDLKKMDTTWTMEDIHWVLTVPAIWNDKAKQFMRKSAVAVSCFNPFPHTTNRTRLLWKYLCTNRENQLNYKY